MVGCGGGWWWCVRVVGVVVCVGGGWGGGAAPAILFQNSLSFREKKTLAPPRRVVSGDSAGKRIVPAFSSAPSSSLEVLKEEVEERRALMERGRETERETLWRWEVYLTVTGDGLTADQW